MSSITISDEIWNRVKLASSAALSENSANNGIDSAETYLNILKVMSFGIDSLISNAATTPNFNDQHPPWRPCVGGSPYATYDYAPLRQDTEYTIRIGPGEYAWGAITVYSGENQKDLVVAASRPFSSFEKNNDLSIDITISPTQKNIKNEIVVPSNAKSIMVRQFFKTKEKNGRSLLDIHACAPYENIESKESRQFRLINDYHHFMLSWLEILPFPAPATKDDCNKSIHVFKAADYGVRWTSPHVTHGIGYFMLSNTETLCLKIPRMDSAFWSCELWSPSMTGLMNEDQASGVSSHEVFKETDGSCYIYVSATNKAVRNNWLDTCGAQWGVVYFRVLDAIEPMAEITATVTTTTPT